MKNPIRIATVAPVGIATMLLSALPAAAHVGGSSGGFVAGFVHPFTGIDHLVAIAGVGVLAAFRGRGTVLSLPTAFLAAMAGGAILAIAGAAIPGAEVMIILSLLTFGILLGSGERLGLLPVHGAVAFFAIFHGVAHGNEMALSAAPSAYILGFVSASALLLGIGAIFAAPMLQRLGSRRRTEVLGAMA